jgi:hypothetical protein
MSLWAWLGVLTSTFVTTLALGAYITMAMPYFDNLPYMEEMKKNTGKAVMVGLVIWSLFFGIYYLGAQFLNQDTSGPLLLFAAFIIALPVSLLLGTETWDRRNGHGMNLVPGPRAVVIATGIGLAELSGVSLLFVLIL